MQRDADGPLVSPEVVVIAALPLQKTGTDANVQVRGVTPRALEVHERSRCARAGSSRRACCEMVVGEDARTRTRASTLGDTLKLGGTAWTVVGIMDAGGSAFDSEIWCDADLLDSTFQRPAGVYQSVTLRLTSRDALDALQARVAGDPRLRVQVERETDYYAKASQMMTEPDPRPGLDGGGGHGPGRGLRRPQHDVLRGGRADARDRDHPRARLRRRAPWSSPSCSRP